MLDNAPWEAMQVTMARAGWVAREEFYSMRNFLVLQDREEPTDRAHSYGLHASWRALRDRAVSMLLRHQPKIHSSDDDTPSPEA